MSEFLQLICLNEKEIALQKDYHFLLTTYLDNETVLLTTAFSSLENLERIRMDLSSRYPYFHSVNHGKNDFSIHRYKATDTLVRYSNFILF